MKYAAFSWCLADEPGDDHFRLDWRIRAALRVAGNRRGFLALSYRRGHIIAVYFVKPATFSRLTRLTLALAVLGGVALVINWLLLFAAYSRVSIGMATVVYNTQPFMLVLLSMILGERVSAVKWGWLLLAFGGVVILLSSELTPTHGDNLVTGIALALCAAFFMP